MKAAVLHGVRDLRIEEVPTPKPNDDQVLIETKAASICGTDVHFFTGELTGRYPWTLGHDFSGVIKEVGKNASRFEVGEGVIAEIVRYCGTCYFCRRGDYQLCVSAEYMGFGVDGAFAEYLVAPAKNVFEIPRNVSFEEAAIMEPVALGLHVVDFVGPTSDESMAIVGLGPIGLVMAQIGKLRGMRVIGIEPVTERLSLAEDLGIDLTVNPKSEDPVAAVRVFTNNLGANCVVEAVGHQDAVDLADDVVMKGGKIILIGARNGLRGPRVRHENIITYAPSDGGSGNYPKALQLMSEGKINVMKLITKLAPLEQAPEIFDGLSSGRLREIKVLLMAQTSLERSST